jgi:exonuclease SbcC
MLPVRLTLKNFLAYRSPDEIRLEGIHLACLTGQNGAGKSSLLDAMTWALWGKARASRDDDLIHHGQKEMSVQLDFMQRAGDGELTYRVIRKRKSSSTGTLDLFVMQEDGSFKSLSEPSMRQTQATIESLLRMSYETFIHSAFLQQGKADAFTTLKPSERKRVLAEILELDRWAEYEEAAKAEHRRLSREIDVDEGRIKDIQRELEREPALRRELAAAQERHQEAVEKLAAAQAKLAEVEHVRRELPAKKDEKAEWEKRNDQISREMENLTKKIDRLNVEVAELGATIAEQASIEAGHDQLLFARRESDQLSDKMHVLRELDQRKNALSTQLEGERAKLMTQIALLDQDIATLDDDISRADIAKYHTAADEVTALEAKEAQKGIIEGQIAEVETKRAALLGENNSMRDPMRKLRERIDRLKTLDEPNCPLCGRELTPQHRDETVASLENDGKVMGDTFRVNEAQINRLTSDLTAHKAQLDDLRVALTPVNDKKRNLTLLKSALDRATDAQSKRDEKLARRTVLYEQVEQEAFGLDIRAHIAAVDHDRSALGYDEDKHESARESLKTYSEYDQRYQDLQIALKTLPDKRGALEGAYAQQATLMQERDEKVTLIESLIAEIAVLEGLQYEFILRQDEVRIFTDQEREANNRVVTCEQDLNALEKQRERLTKLEETVEANRVERGIYDELKVAFGKKGIPAMIIESAIPELEDSANRLLGRMTDGRMTLRIETLAAKVTGGESETLEIKIGDELGTRSYEMYSGGEAFRINFALRVALSQLLARRAGAQLRTLFLDEGFGTQDDDGRAKLVEAITAVQDDFDLILVITHIDDLRDSFPVHVQVEKTDDGSMVLVR